MGIFSSLMGSLSFLLSVPKSLKGCGNFISGHVLVHIKQRVRKSILCGTRNVFGLRKTFLERSA